MHMERIEKLVASNAFSPVILTFLKSLSIWFRESTSDWRARWLI